jgi:pimeloyl-ACP methyl ester carboxylesterase
MPVSIGSASLPVLVLFHGAYENEWSVYEKTDYFTLAMQRGWIVIAPLGAHVGNYGIEYSQLNVEAALERLVDIIAPSFGANVDLDRFYAVGFSMGGGAAASFAARHVNALNGLHFAGVVIHTGSTSLPYAAKADLELQRFFEKDWMFCGRPDEPMFGFDYLRVSSMDLDYPSGPIDPSTDMIRNLSHVPVLSYYCWDDTKGAGPDLQDQTLRTHEHHAGPLKGEGRLWRNYEKPGNKSHDWKNLSQRRVLNFLAPLSYQQPTGPGITPVLADRDGMWHAFNITQPKPLPVVYPPIANQSPSGAFSPFAWHIAPDSTTPNTNVLLVQDVENVAELGLPSPSAVGLSTSDVGGQDKLKCYFVTADGVPLRLILGEFQSKPKTVNRTGGGTNWSYHWDPNTFELILNEPADSVDMVTWTIGLP